MTRERPILFSAPMVRAILAGTKTQTRRIVHKRDIAYAINGDLVRFGDPGDRLWVKETFFCDHFDYSARTPESERHEMLKMMDYRASHACGDWEAGCPCNDDSGRSNWRPSIFMPRWASRIDLEIEGVHTENLQEISEADAVAEGFKSTPSAPPLRSMDTAVKNFALVWDSINGDRATWDSNPLVWVVQFKRVRP